jgi:hypothetical protein
VLLTPERRRLLDGLLQVDPSVGMARATWLRQLPVQASPRVVLDELDKLEFLRELGVEGWDLGALPAKRVTLLAGWVRTASNQALAQSSVQRRYPALLAFGVERLAGVIDGLVELFDRLVADTNAKARRRLGEHQQSIAAAANAKVLLLAKIARVLLAPDLVDDERLAAVFAAVPKDRLAHALAECERIARPADDSHVDLLGDHYSHLRQCVPRWLELLRFRSLRSPRIVQAWQRDGAERHGRSHAAATRLVQQRSVPGHGDRRECGGRNRHSEAAGRELDMGGYSRAAGRRC